MKKLICLSGISAVLLISAMNLNAETEKGFTGVVKDVDCKNGEIRMSGKNGKEELFNITEKTEFKYVKGCEEIKKDGFALIRFSEIDGRKVVSLIKYKAPRSEKQSTATDGGKTTANLFMGWVGSVDCEKGVLTLQRMDDRSKTETFSLDKDTAFSNIKGCSDIKPNWIVAIRYGGDGDRKVVKTIKPMIQERK